MDLSAERSVEYLCLRQHWVQLIPSLVMMISLVGFLVYVFTLPKTDFAHVHLTPETVAIAHDSDELLASEILTTDGFLEIDAERTTPGSIHYIHKVGTSSHHSTVIFIHGNDQSFQSAEYWDSLTTRILEEKIKVRSTVAISFFGYGRSVGPRTLPSSKQLIGFLSHHDCPIKKSDDLILVARSAGAQVLLNADLSHVGSIGIILIAPVIPSAQLRKRSTLLLDPPSIFDIPLLIFFNPLDKATTDIQVFKDVWRASVYIEMIEYNASPKEMHLPELMHPHLFISALDEFVESLTR